MTKTKRLKQLSNLIKKRYNLDAVTCLRTEKQHERAGIDYRPNRVNFKMKYKLTGDDIVVNCPISWLVIDAGEDELIVKTCGEMVAKQPEVRRTLSNMAKNAQARAVNDRDN